MNKLKSLDFDVVDENGKLIDTMKLVSAYPSVVEPNKTAVYYQTKKSEQIFNANVSLKAIPFIKPERYKNKQDKLFVVGIGTSGSKHAEATIRNGSNWKVYDNVQVAVIGRKQDNEIVCVMTGTIDSIKPDEKIEIQVNDSLQLRDIGPDIVTTYQTLAYINP
ncbi:MAG: hypothetical protein VB064_07665 [Oscillospiraceae bacterium]|nr:hypothetical protein [Oscillospiraceae bacterium]